jgi:VanW like protein
MAESRTPLWTAEKDSEIPFVAGKIHNLRLAIPRLNGVEVPPDRVLSFWKQIGRASRLKGYARGRELREGCLIPSVGGGLCQLSNALYETAVKAGLEIVERHAHSKVIPGSLAQKGLDATVFWNYVDLRISSHHAFRVEAFLTAESLVVRLRGVERSKPRLARLTIAAPDLIENCSACERTGCFRHSRPRQTQFGHSAYLVDEYWPEFDRYISSTRREPDLICLPIDGKRFRKSNYSWTTAGFSKVKQVPSVVLHRSYQLRKLASQGAARQRALLAFSERLAGHFASFLSYETTHLVVMQSLLPYLWLGGHLGGRTFDVFMTRLPLNVLHQTLDDAYRLHPESTTLADFRADNLLVNAETEALREARKIITPHSMVAATFPHKAELIAWITPEAPGQFKTQHTTGLRLIFPAPTVARKGAYELRAALQGSGAQLTILGPVLEDAGFWAGVRVNKASPTENWLESASAVVLPAFVEHRPARLLQSIVGGIPVIASTACGLENMKGVTSVAAGDVESLRTAIDGLRSNAEGVR